jgi:hypothetical protein
MNIKKEQIIKLTNKHKTWKGVFLSYLEKNPELDIKELSLIFEKLLKYKNLIKEDVDITYAKSLINQAFHKNILEDLGDKVEQIVFEKQTKNFIKNLKTKKYEHLFNENVESILETIIYNKISQKSLRKHFFNKIAQYKKASELFNSLILFQEKSIIWTKEHYIELINTLNVNILREDDNALTIHVHDFHSCKTLAPQAWCISRSEYLFNYYTENLNKQIIHFDFNKTIDDNLSVIGLTLDTHGKIKHSHLKDDSRTPDDIRLQFKFPPVQQSEIEEYLEFENNVINKLRVISQCKNITLYDKYLNICSNNLEENFNCMLMSIQDDNKEAVNYLLNHKNFDASYKSQNIIDAAAMILNSQSIYLLLDNITYLSTNLNAVIYRTIHDQRFDLFKTLMDTSNSNVNYDTILKISLESFNFLVISYLRDNKHLQFDCDIKEAMCIAVQNGYCDAIKLILNIENASIYLGDKNQVVLQMAIQYEQPLIIKLLLEENLVDPSYNNNFAIKLAIKYHQLDIIEIFLKDNRVNIIKNNNYLTILLNKKNIKVQSFWKNNNDNYLSDLMALSLELDINMITEIPDSKIYIKEDAMFNSLILKRENAKSIFLRNKKIKNLVIEKTQDSYFLLIIAMELQDIDLINYILLNFNSNVQSQCDPLIIASEYGFCDVVKFLLKQDKNKVTSNNCLALRMASRKKQINIIDILIKEKCIMDIINKNWIHEHILSEHQEKIIFALT